jgi:hypothetical protein
MQAVRLAPVIVSFVVLAAHFARAGETALAVTVLLLPLLLVLRRRWGARAVELALVLGAIEWIRTTLSLVDLRRAHGLPWLRLVAILGAVAAVTLASALFVESWWRRRRRAPAALEAA